VQLGWPAPRSQKRGRPGPATPVQYAVGAAGGSSSSGPLGRELPARTGVGVPRHRAPPVLPGVADAGSKPHAAARVGKRGEMALHEGASLARAGSDARPICGAQGGGRRLSDTWEQVPRAGVGEGCGRPTERDARDHALGRRRRKRPLADLAAQASGLPAHACCRAREISTAGRSRVPSEQVVRRPEAAVERPHCSTSHDGGNWAPSRSS